VFIGRHTSGEDDVSRSATYPFSVRVRFEDAVARANFDRCTARLGFEEFLVLRVWVFGEITLRHRAELERSAHHALDVLLRLFLQSLRHNDNFFSSSS